MPEQAPPLAEERMVIFTAQLTLIVDDVEVALPRVQEMATQMKGYIVSSSSYRTATDRLAATITIRVPADHFQEALQRLRGMARKVEGESLSGQDVTDQYVDLKARLRALRATEEELLALLREVRESEGNAEQKAQAILSIYDQLTTVRSQIEQIQGQMQYLEQMSAMATITVELRPYEPKVEQPVVDEGFRPSRTLRAAARALVSVLQWLYQALIWFVVVLLPLLLLLGLPVGWIVFVIVWRQRRRKRSG
jgi:arginyl-tRNA--protein-N-Asp/Glu arginylyltransferase